MMRARHGMTRTQDDPTERTIAFYDAHAVDFSKRTGCIDMRDLYAPFLELVVAGGSILDAGCGPGRDAAEFVRRGYAVTAFDASIEMVRLCGRVDRVIVRHQRFDEIEDQNAFDGIWASASLLHVQLPELPDMLDRLARALRRGGVLYASFKRGDGEVSRGERRFTDLDEVSLRGLIDDAAELQLRRTWVSAAKQKAAEPREWVNVLATRRR